MSEYSKAKEVIKVMQDPDEIRIQIQTQYGMTLIRDIDDYRRALTTALKALDILCEAEKEMPEETDMADIDIVSGVEGKSCYINNYRVAGSKPWGSGTIIYKWNCSIKDILTSIKLSDCLPIIASLKAEINDRRIETNFEHKVSEAEIEGQNLRIKILEARIESLKKG